MGVGLCLGLQRHSSRLYRVVQPDRRRQRGAAGQHQRKARAAKAYPDPSHCDSISLYRNGQSPARVCSYYKTNRILM